MAVYPFTPVPSSIQAPSVVDPMHSFETDSGTTFRRSKHSRPQRRYQLDYLGKNTAEWRIIRDFIQAQRLGVLPFEFLHMTATDAATYSNTTPVVVTMWHAYTSGQWVSIGSSNPNTSIHGGWRITRLSSTTFSLDGSIAGGAGTCQVYTYIPQAVGVFSEEGDPSPVKLMGPESTTSNRGRFSFSVQILELL
jgi:hypothetical protein